MNLEAAHGVCKDGTIRPAAGPLGAPRGGGIATKEDAENL